MKKHHLYILLAFFAFSASAQTTAEKEGGVRYTDSFMHEALELYDWKDIEQKFAASVNISTYKASTFFSFLFRSGDPSMQEYLKQVKNGNINKKNATDYWLNKLPDFEKIYREKYLPQQEKMWAAKKGGGNNAVLEGGENCNNLDFYTGTTDGWDGMWNDQGGFSGSNMYGALTVTGLNSSPALNSMGYAHELCSGGTDPNVPISRVPPGHTAALRLGNDSAYKVIAGIANTPYPFNHQIISNTFLVTESNKAISYWYAVVLSQYNPNNHAADIQPYFKIRMYDQVGNEIVCAQYDIDALTAASIGGFGLISTLVDDGFGGPLPYDFYYKDWSQVMIPLSDYIGQNVTITFETSDCAGGGHFGYAYIAVDCAPLPNITINPIPCQGGTGTLTGPAGAATYSWTGPGIVGASNAQTINVSTAGTYSVTMTTLGNSGFTCSFSVDTTIGPPPSGPVADFTYAALCAGVPVQFTDASNGNGGTITAWNWDFGDGGTSTLINPTHTYAVGIGSTFVVSYTITTSGGCSDVYSTTINLNQGSAADFTSNTVCIGGTTQFTNTSPGTNNVYVWDFGDNSPTSQLTSPGHVYANVGTYQASLTVTTAAGCTNTTTHPVLISNPPTASFTNSLPCLSSPTNFTNTSSVLTGTYSWNFGDPGTVSDISALSNPSYQYNSAGVFTVSLSIDAGNNCVASTTQTLNIAPAPSATITPLAPFCPGDLVPDPAVQSTPAMGVNYNWSNNNVQIGLGALGSGIAPAFTAAANNSGNMISGVVSITPYLNGCPGPAANYTVVIKPAPVIIPPSLQFCPNEISPLINLSSTPTGGATSYNWTNTTPGVFIGLADTQGTSSIPSFTTVNTSGFAQTILISANATLDGCTGSTSVFPIVVNPFPLAAFTHSRACSGKPTTFNSQSSINSGSISDLVWDLDNDGQYDDASGDPISAILAPTGFHSVSLQVTSDKGCLASTSQQIYVNNTPFVNFSGDVLEGCPLHPVTFIDTTYIPLPEHIVGYNWNFGNLSNSSVAGPVNAVYDNESNTESAFYSVSLEVTSDSGCVGSVIKTNYITVFPLPKADFVWGPTDVDVIDPTVYFADQSVGASGEIPLVWYLGDLSVDFANNYSTLTNPVHVYPELEANYAVTQWVSNSFGCRDSVTKIIDIKGAFTFYIPNAFTPNRGNLNAGFKGTGIGINNATYSMLIFDRWGNQIFESHDLEEEWDGTYKGLHVQNDVYVWKVNFDDYQGLGHQYAGTVTLIR